MTRRYFEAALFLAATFLLAGCAQEPQIDMYLDLTRESYGSTDPFVRSLALDVLAAHDPASQREAMSAAITESTNDSTNDNSDYDDDDWLSDVALNHLLDAPDLLDPRLLQAFVVQKRTEGRIARKSDPNRVDQVSSECVALSVLVRSKDKAAQKQAQDDLLEAITSERTGIRWRCAVEMAAESNLKNAQVAIRTTGITKWELVVRNKALAILGDRDALEWLRKNLDKCDQLFHAGSDKRMFDLFGWKTAELDQFSKCDTPYRDVYLARFHAWRGDHSALRELAKACAARRPKRTDSDVVLLSVLSTDGDATVIPMVEMIFKNSTRIEDKLAAAAVIIKIHRRERLRKSEK